MPSPMSIESRSLLRLLDDGQWHDLEEIHVKLAATVAPGKALRRYEDRAALRAAKEGPRRSPELSDEEKIQSGQRILASVAINSMKKRYVEFMETDEGRKIRRRPGVDITLPPRLDAADGDPPSMPEEAFDGIVQSLDAATEPSVGSSPTTGEPSVSPDACPSCGLYVVNRAQHAEFHSLHDGEPEEAAPPAVAFFSEAQVREIVRDEVSRVLDEFQQGMQNWLIHRFAALETMIQGLPRAPGAPTSRAPGASFRGSVGVQHPRW